MTIEKTNDLIVLGNTLMDFLVEINDNLLLKFNLKKGEFHLIEEKQARQLLNRLHQNPNLTIETVPGGSSANTAKGIALLGGSVILCGKVGDDQHGENYIQQITAHGVISKISRHPSITGHALTFISPDAERTFSVHLGSAIHLAKEDILEEDIKNSKILHLEGYQLEGPTKETVLHAIELAQKHQTLISLDLADPGVIRRNKLFFREIINRLDILFLNEQEAKEFTNLEPEQAVQELANLVKIAIVKLGEKGSLICQDGITSFIQPYPAQAIDTTGAGDTYAAGFLYGYTQGWPLEKAGKLGSLMAAKIVEQKGVKTQNLNLEEIKKEINKKR